VLLTHVRLTNMKWKLLDITQWHPWFAWYPVQIEDGLEIYWLEKVQRKYLEHSEMYIYLPLEYKRGC